jgi:succinate dehydrogenase/fumarate reductase cytochrome b subunit
MLRPFAAGILASVPPPASFFLLLLLLLLQSLWSQPVGFKDTMDMVNTLKNAGLGSLELFCMVSSIILIGCGVTCCDVARLLL